MRSALFVLVLVAAASGQRTWIVDASGSGHFHEIQPAVDAAAPGDRIEVLAGRYASVVVDEGLDIVGRGTVEIGGAFVRDVARDQTMTIEGIRAQALQLSDCSGTVVLRNLTVFAALTSAGAVISGCDRVVFSRCALYSLSPFGFSGGPGASIDRSGVHLLDCDVRGGQTAPLQGSDGPAGISVWASELTVDGGFVRGGAGVPAHRDPWCWLCVMPGGPGGPGIRVRDGSDVLVVGGATVAGGPRGPNFGGLPPGPDGRAISLWWGTARVARDCKLTGSGGSIYTSIQEQPSLRVWWDPAEPRQMQAALEFHPNGAAALFFDLRAGTGIAVPGFEVPFLLTASSALVATGPTDASGMARFRLPLPNDPSLGYHEPFFQAIAARASPPVIAASLLGALRAR